MRNHRITVLSAGLLLLTLAGAADAEQGRSPHRQTEGMMERLHDRDNRQARHGNRDHGHSESQRADRGRHGWGHDRHDDNSRHDRDLRWGHERWRENDRHNRRGYWHDYHHGYHRGHDYRHRYYNNYHYYYNASGFYFPEYGFIARGHVHGRHCPHWHFEDFATGFVLGAIIND